MDHHPQRISPPNLSPPRGYQSAPYAPRFRSAEERREDARRHEEERCWEEQRRREDEWRKEDERRREAEGRRRSEEHRRCEERRLDDERRRSETLRITKKAARERALAEHQHKEDIAATGNMDRWADHQEMAGARADSSANSFATTPTSSIPQKTTMVSSVNLVRVVDPLESNA
jgi:hypothetical protein